MTYTIKDSRGKLLYSTVDRKITSPYSIISSAAVLSPEKEYCLNMMEKNVQQLMDLSFYLYRFNAYTMGT